MICIYPWVTLAESDLAHWALIFANKNTSRTSQLVRLRSRLQVNPQLRQDAFFIIDICILSRVVFNENNLSTILLRIDSDFGLIGICPYDVSFG